MYFLNFKYSCIIDTPFSLFLYLLMCKDGDWNKTVFFIGDGIEETSIKHLKRTVYFPTDHCHYCTKKLLLRSKVRALFYRMIYISHTKLYAQDHLEASSQLIGRNKYVHIEDAPGFYSFNHPEAARIPRGLRSKLRRLILLGPMYGQTYGRNKYCTDRWVTEVCDLQSPILQDRHCTLLNLKQLWNSASEEKKQYIYTVFGINEIVLQKLRKQHTIIFTQPFEEGGLKMEDIVPILKPYIEKYKYDGGVVLKLHPRDKMEWNKAFSDVPVITLRIPMQILNILGVEYKRAITFFSTSISAMSPETEIIWLGTNYPKLADVYPDQIKCPYVGKFKNIYYK